MRNVFLILVCILALSCFSYGQNSFWVKQIGGSVAEKINAIDVDKSGNIYSTGAFKDTVDFDPGSGIFNLVAHPLSGNLGNPFVSKLDPSGNFLWAKAFLGTSPNGEHGSGYAVASDDSGNVYITGEYWGDSIDFDPGPGTYYLPFVGSGDCFISKLDKSGNFVWAQTYAYPSMFTSEDGTIIKLDASGNIYVVIRYSYSFQSDIILLNLDPSGTIQWTKTLSGGGNEHVTGMVIGSDGNLYLTGNFKNFINLTPFNLSGNGFSDSFICKLNPSGTVIQASHFEGTGTVTTSQIVLDSEFNIYLNGIFTDTVDFDPGPGVYQMISTTSGGLDAFFAKLDSSFNFIWAKAIGGNNNDFATSLVLDSASNIYIIGGFRDSVDFDSGPGVYQMVASSPFGDLFYLKLDSAGNFIWSNQMNAFINNGNNCLAIDKSGSIYSIGAIVGTADFDMGPGIYNLTSVGTSDMFIYKFRECTPVSGTDVITACDSLTWIDGITYFNSTNIPEFTIIGGSSTNCDSIVTLNLNIINSTTSTDSITACDSLTWLDGNTYTSSNNSATMTLTGSNGCDSVIVLDLIINNVDVTVSVDTVNAILTAAASGATAYQWLDCSTGYAPISGATSQSYAPSQNGNYAVAITQNGCTDTSACIPIVISGLETINSPMGIRCHPNPSSGLLTITFDRLPETKKTVMLYNTSSQLVFTEELTNHLSTEINVTHLQDGVYMVMVKAGNGVFKQKIVIHH